MLMFNHLLADTTWKNAVVPQQTNLLINPKYPGYVNLVKPVVVEPFIFDARLS